MSVVRRTTGGPEPYQGRAEVRSEDRRHSAYRCAPWRYECSHFHPRTCPSRACRAGRDGRHQRSPASPPRQRRARGQGVRTSGPRGRPARRIRRRGGRPPPLTRTPARGSGSGAPGTRGPGDTRPRARRPGTRAPGARTARRRSPGPSGGPARRWAVPAVPVALPAGFGSRAGRPRARGPASAPRPSGADAGRGGGRVGRSPQPRGRVPANAGGRVAAFRRWTVRARRAYAESAQTGSAPRAHRRGVPRRGLWAGHPPGGYSLSVRRSSASMIR